ncbi:hypothetical protein [Clostridium botulinum]|uniref:Transglycosylase n=1 Tax=Clostridium botulinum (strain Langeland / NCTC 10281 / Type F) TaxID=441772 RepID=A7GI78_CLOBL|nr:hypothetical protein [Clostridium botulinum]ABS42177.1 conserved hypothetical protein [Clostridium botulinum F str. Langeland]ADG00852.1 conserved hypothetical protein [Clostridium botulinum F str. 230613]KKM40645.1 hypothetical protein VT72_11180 [Clostridium botulinum]MBY6794382.1 hypothetical protein [Clostridium botulinum]MBY6938170.1 hypothetical protein [Clostridium botulinum]
METYCDKGCKKKFEIKEFKERKLKDGVIETYFKCPKCGKKYICFYTDKEIRLLQAKLRSKWSKVSREDIEQLQGKVKVKMDILKGKMLGAQ